MINSLVTQNDATLVTEGVEYHVYC